MGGECVGMPIQCEPLTTCPGLEIACIAGTCPVVNCACSDVGDCPRQKCHEVVACVDFTCTYATTTDPCDDGNPCTINARCGDGACHGPRVDFASAADAIRQVAAGEACPAETLTASISKRLTEAANKIDAAGRKPKRMGKLLLAAEQKLLKALGVTSKICQPTRKRKKHAISCACATALGEAIRTEQRHTECLGQ
jgi:hypothetical protein